MDNIPSPQNYFQTNYRSIIPIIQKASEHYWDNFFEYNFVDLGDAFALWVNGVNCASHVLHD